MSRRCAGCGYFLEVHDLGTQRCPIETADRNGRRGKFRDDEPVERKTWFGLLLPVSKAELAAREAAAAAEAEPVVVGPPQVVARPPLAMTEIAGYQGKQAVGLGRTALAAGWGVEPWYWRAADGVEGCALRLARKTLRAVATWNRKAGNVGKTSGWSAAVAYAWRTDVDRPATRLNHTELEGLLT